MHASNGDLIVADAIKVRMGEGEWLAWLGRMRTEPNDLFLLLAGIAPVYAWGHRTDRAGYRGVGSPFSIHRRT